MPVHEPVEMPLYFSYLIVLHPHNRRGLRDAVFFEVGEEDVFLPHVVTFRILEMFLKVFELPQAAGIHAACCS